MKNLTLDGTKTPPKQNGTVRYTWIRVALFNRVLATIIAYLVRHSRYDVVITSNVYNIKTHQPSCSLCHNFHCAISFNIFSCLKSPSINIILIINLCNDVPFDSILVMCGTGDQERLSNDRVGCVLTIFASTLTLRVNCYSDM